MRTLDTAQEQERERQGSASYATSAHGAGTNSPALLRV